MIVKQATQVLIWGNDGRIHYPRRGDLQVDEEEAVLVMSAATAARGRVEIAGRRSIEHPKQEDIGVPAWGHCACPT
jgi:hypothetical protein